MSYEQMAADELIARASTPEKEAIAGFLGTPSGALPVDLVEHLCAAGSHSIASWWRGRHVEYTEVAQDVASKLGVKNIRSLSAYRAEEEAVVAALNSVLAEVSPEQRLIILAELAQAQGSSAKGLVGATGGLIAANLSGFALYTAASSAVAAVAGVAGVTLPFAAFTTMSTVLSAATGPIGWGVLGGWAIYKLGGADFKQTLPCVLSIAAIRARLNDEKEREIRALKSFRDGELRAEELHFQKLSALLDKHRTMGPTTLIDRNSLL